MTPDFDALGLFIAALGGTAVGLERQWSGHADGPSARFGGLRTFTMLGALAGLSGWLWTINLSGAAMALLAGAVIIIVAAYAAASRHDVDATTEIAALVVLAAGVLAGIGHHRMASAIIALESLLLVEKSRLHSLVSRIHETGLRAGVRFAVMALVILPMLPEGPYGPLGGVRPRELWALVLFFSGLSFLGFLARRVVGPAHGFLLTGIIGGIMSSTSTTLTFARSSRAQRTVDRALAFGAIAANAVMYPRVLIATAVLNVALLSRVALYVAIPAVIAAAIAGFGAAHATEDSSRDESERNPLQLSKALQMAVLFQVVLVAVYLAQQWGRTGVLTSAAVLGLTDVDALTMSMARGATRELSLDIAALAIAVGIAANTAMKLGIAIVFGSPRFRLIAGGALSAMLLSAIAMVFSR